MAPPGNDILKSAIECFQTGRLADAERLFKSLLAQQPNHVAALNILGVLLASLHRYAEAEPHLRSALKFTANSDATLYNYGIVLKGLGRSAEAVEYFSKALAINPDVPDTWNNRGTVHNDLKHYEQAVQDFDRAIALRHDDAAAFCNKGKSLGALRRPVESLSAFDRAIALDPNLVEAWLGRGNALIELKRYDEASNAHDRALVLNPTLPEGWLARANACVRLRRYEEALAACHRALELAPQNTDSWIGRGHALIGLERYDEALSAYEKARDLAPDLAAAWLGRGDVFYLMQRFNDALDDYDRALAIAPNFAEAWLSRGNVMSVMKRHFETVESYEQAFKLNPGLRHLDGGAYLHSKQHICDWNNLQAEWESFLAAIRSGDAVADPFAVLGGPSSDADMIKVAKTFTAKRCSLPAVPPLWQNDYPSNSRIRIAYISPDFRDHPISHLVADLFERHDRTQFETIAIALGPADQSEMRVRLRRAFDRFVDVHNRSDLDVARLIRDMKVDIVIDLGGFTLGSRPAILSLRPAPIQVTYLSYPGVMGHGHIDYIIADRVVIPESYRSLLSERVVYLPNSYLGYDSKQEISDHLPARTDQGLPAAGFVFCAYNNTFKLMPHTFDVWMRLLGSVSGSVLWLMGTNAAAVGNLRREAQQRGVHPDRLCFAPFVKNTSDHLARYRLADLFLDTLPFNAQTTACDALWAGLPVLTRLGSTFVGRTAASLLTAIEMPELITHSAEEYEALALKLATDRPYLAGIRRKLAGQRLSAPLFNTGLFTKHVEAAYSAMVQRHRSGLPPDHLVIQP